MAWPFPALLKGHLRHAFGMWINEVIEAVRHAGGCLQEGLMERVASQCVAMAANP